MRVSSVLGIEKISDLKPGMVLEGTVTNVVGALNTGVYQVEDGTGKIFVLSGRGIPAKGARVQVSGNVTQGVNIMGKSFGTTIQEHGHKVRF